MRKRAKWLALALVCGVVMAGLIYGALAWSTARPMPDHDFFDRGKERPLVIAHRGGAGLWPENTLFAFEQAQALGVDVIEIDVRSTSDGVLVLMHDETVDRTTDGKGALSQMTLAQVKRLDAGYGWSPDGGQTFPFRGRDVRVPTLEEVFESFPAMRFNIEPKQDAPQVVQNLCRLIRAEGKREQVLVGSFRQGVLDQFRRACPEVATSASPSEVSSFLAMHKVGLDDSYSPAMQALQVPEQAGGVRVLTESFVKAAHRRNLKVHAWTVNDEAAMRRLLAMGVDGIITDQPARLKALLGQR